MQLSVIFLMVGEPITGRKPGPCFWGSGRAGAADRDCPSEGERPGRWGVRRQVLGAGEQQEQGILGAARTPPQDSGSITVTIVRWPRRTQAPDHRPHVIMQGSTSCPSWCSAG